MTRRPSTSIVANPVLVGAVTILVTIVAVFLAYNANSGLPFVPTYDLRAELPSGAKLVEGNEVRVGGFRVGQVTKIEPAVRRVAGRDRAIAVVELELDRVVEPLPADTTARVTPTSALGLKYIELTPGSAGRELAPGDTIPLAQTSESAEFENLLEAFPEETRAGVRAATEGFGDALAGRGQDLNEAIAGLGPLVGHAERVMGNLSDPATRLRDLLPALEATVGEVAPVSESAAAVFSHMADTFAALDRDPGALRATIERTPPALDAATGTLRRARPVLAGLADAAGRLRPAVDQMPATLPPLDRALATGTPVLRLTVPLSERLGAAAIELRELVRNPSTLLSLSDLRTFVTVARPFVEFAAPFQTVCNYSVYHFNVLGEHQSSPEPGGTGEPQLAKLVPSMQPNSPLQVTSSRPFDLRPGQEPQDATFGPEPAGRVLEPGVTAIDAQGNADCEIGQVGYPNGRYLGPLVRRDHQGSNPNDPNDIVFGTLADGTPAGQNAMVRSHLGYPFLSGGTWVTRRLGIENLRDVP